MGAHNRGTASTVETTPIHRERYKNRDPNRLPETFIKQKADERRANMLKDAPDCTILMTISQFCADYLNIPEDDFKDVCEWKTAVDTWWSFRKALGRKTTDNEKRKAKVDLSEKVYTEAWVCA